MWQLILANSLATDSFSNTELDRLLKVSAMAVFQYKAAIPDREDYFEIGTVVARDELEAREKLKKLQFKSIRLKRITGFKSFLLWFSADVR
ncbi:MAG TPA: hypothetical protein PKY35_03950 [Candidatus Hydrogenedentes bacterium]|nr:hypothetical protein [Candidatus Hydrogenedentota bacterium]HOL76158.1 hypothetical protein [Candidatus Hydrogenedentota bacterium]HPO84773.1 hypothetical protein [Candidatus Hydrogenedentota bacterium]